MVFALVDIKKAIGTGKQTRVQLGTGQVLHAMFEQDHQCRHYWNIRSIPRQGVVLVLASIEDLRFPKTTKPGKKQLGQKVRSGSVVLAYVGICDTVHGRVLKEITSRLRPGWILQEVGFEFFFVGICRPLFLTDDGN
jgi:hypothetical protein